MFSRISKCGLVVEVLLPPNQTSFGPLTHLGRFGRSFSRTVKTRSSATTSAASSRTDSLIQAIESRRTYYSLESTSPISDSRILELVNSVTKHCPSSHNSQSSRLVVLLKEQHKRLWSSATDILRIIVPADKFAPTAKKLRGLKAGYGTILFYEDTTVVSGLQDEWPLYKDKFPTWSEQTSAMHQILLWIALEAEGLGCNLQHYNPLIDEMIYDTWKVDKRWSLKAQMVFGGVTGEPKQKGYKPLEDRVIVHGS